MAGCCGRGNERLLAMKWDEGGISGPAVELLVSQEAFCSMWFVG